MLSDAQRTAFEREGYLVVPACLDTTLLARVEAEYDRLLDPLVDGALARRQLAAPPAGGFLGRLRALHQAGVDWFQSLDISLPGGEIDADTPFHIGPAVFDLMTHPALLDVAADLIGPELALNPIQHVRLKPPTEELASTEERAHVGLTAWHQDRGVAHADADRTHMVTVWVAMTDATVENGCLTVVPGPVDDGLIDHCPAGQTHIPASLLDMERARPVPVPAGSLVVLHPSTPHASLPNQSAGMRWSFDLRYHRLGEPSGRAHFPSFVVRSANHTPVADWEAMHSAWRAARDRLAHEPHIPIHRWDGNSPACA
ncbi:MAG: phytanoyl-CoA dioxygenase family protein [Pseudomonadota bacterium]